MMMEDDPAVSLRRRRKTRKEGRQGREGSAVRTRSRWNGGEGGREEGWCGRWRGRWMPEGKEGKDQRRKRWRKRKEEAKALAWRGLCRVGREGGVGKEGRERV